MTGPIEGGAGEDLLIEYQDVIGAECLFMAQAMDTTTGRQMWTGRSDSEMTDLFDWQGQMVSNIARPLAPTAQSHG